MNLEQKAITSVEVSEMMEVRHSDVLRKLEGDKSVKGIIPTMTEHNFALSDYFTESTYNDASGKENKCYLVTKIGCDFLANKFTGEKGILFTAKYVKRFDEMEEVINNYDGLSTELKAIIMQDKKIQAIESNIDTQSKKITEVEQEFNTFKKDMPLLGIECETITTSKNYKVVPLLGGKNAPAYKNSNLRGRVYRDMEGQLRREFGVKSYKAIKRNQCDLAVKIINSYKLPLSLQEEIEYENSQLSI